jgi:hypothetical protein
MRTRYANVTSTLALAVALGGTSYAATQLAAHSVGPKQLKASAVVTSKLAGRSVTHSKIAPGAVSDSNVRKNALSLKRLVGVDVGTTLTEDAGFVAAGSCVTTLLRVPGAKVGQPVVMTFIGEVPAPPGLTFEPLKISSANRLALRLCNPTHAASQPFANVGVRVVTFG